MTLDRAAVEKLADLARIDLNEDEIEQMQGELSQILQWVSTVKNGVEPDTPVMSHPMSMTNVMRPDEVRESMSVDEVLSEAPESESGQFKVPRILGESQ